MKLDLIGERLKCYTKEFGLYSYATERKTTTTTTTTKRIRKNAEIGGIIFRKMNLPAM